MYLDICGLRGQDLANASPLVGCKPIPWSLEASDSPLVSSTLLSGSFMHPLLLQWRHLPGRDNAFSMLTRNSTLEKLNTRNSGSNWVKKKQSRLEYEPCWFKPSVASPWLHGLEQLFPLCSCHELRLGTWLLAHEAATQRQSLAGRCKLLLLPPAAACAPFTKKHVGLANVWWAQSPPGV